MPALYPGCVYLEDAARFQPDGTVYERGWYAIGQGMPVFSITAAAKPLGNAAKLTTYVRGLDVATWQAAVWTPNPTTRWMSFAHVIVCLNDPNLIVSAYDSARIAAAKPAYIEIVTSGFSPAHGDYGRAAAGGPWVATPTGGVTFVDPGLPPR